MAKAPATEWGIPFMDSMVLAILEGRKDVTRRISPQWAKRKPGDRLWVREAWNVGDWEGGDGYRSWFEPTARIPRGRHDFDVIYRADGFPAVADVPSYRPSIHMPRWASRLTLEVVSVTEERPAVQAAEEGQPRNVWLDIDDAEGRREGFASAEAFHEAWRTMHADHVGPVYRIEFRRLP